MEGSRLLYGRKEAARQISVSVRSLDYLTAAKQLETRRIGKKVLITHASLVRFSQGNHYESPKELAAESSKELSADSPKEHKSKAA